MSRVVASLSSNEGRIHVRFPYSPADVEAIKGIEGRRWMPKEKAWSIPGDMVAGRQLRAVFGERLEYSPELLAWGRKLRDKERTLRDIATGDKVPDLLRLPKPLTDWIAPFQKEDIAFMANQDGVVNANDAGTGKTVEAIGAVYESGVAAFLPTLVIGPVTPLRNTWAKELRRWYPDVPFHQFVSGNGSWPKNLEAGAWYGTSYSAVSLGKVPAKGWGAVIIDEFHMSGLTNRRTKFVENASKIKSEQRIGLSGTPLDGGIEALFGTLQWADPKTFSSFWTWAARWVETWQDEHGYWKFGGLKPENEEAFFAHHALWMTRRLLDEVRPDIPPPSHETITVDLGTRQKEQVKSVLQRSVIKTDSGSLTVDGTLPTQTRLSQLANAPLVVAGSDVDFEKGSAKTAALLETLAGLGIVPGRTETGGVVAVVCSRYAKFARIVAAELQEAGLRVGTLTGKETEDKREAIIREFQEGESIDVVVMSSSVGGVGITLDRADTLHELDAEWSTRKREQVARRIRRMSRVHETTIYHYRSELSYEDYIDDVVAGKLDGNRAVNELRKRFLEGAGVSS